MYSLIYRSSVTDVPANDDLKKLLTQSRERNLKLQITGMLIFFDNRFLQLLEGTEENVKLLYSSICRDERHQQIATLKEGPVEKRIFPGWSMSFRTISGNELCNEPAYKDIYTPNTRGATDLVSLFNFLRDKPENL